MTVNYGCCWCRCRQSHTPRARGPFVTVSDGDSRRCWGSCRFPRRRSSDKLPPELHQGQCFLSAEGGICSLRQSHTGSGDGREPEALTALAAQLWLGCLSLPGCLPGAPGDPCPGTRQEHRHHCYGRHAATAAPPTSCRGKSHPLPAAAGATCPASPSPLLAMCSAGIGWQHRPPLPGHIRPGRPFPYTHRGRHFALATLPGQGVLPFPCREPPSW